MNHDTHQHNFGDLNKTAIKATAHCLTGCAIGEVLGMVISTSLKWSAGPSVGISIILAFVFGYGLSMRPLLKHRLSFGQAFKIALFADSVSIATMELSDNGFILLVPGAINATLSNALFWISLTLSLVVAFIITVPVNRFLIARGKGHAIVHKYHHN